MIAENIAHAKPRLSELVNAALAGEEVVLCKNGTPVGYRFVSVMSALEIAVKARRGRLVLPGASPRTWFDAVVANEDSRYFP